MLRSGRVVGLTGNYAGFAAPALVKQEILGDVAYCDSNIERDKPSVVGFCMDLLLWLVAGAEKFARTMSITTTPSRSVHGSGPHVRKAEFT